MVEPSMRRLLALARTSLLGATSSNSIQEILERSTPGFAFLQAFFSTWLKIDLTTLAAALTIFGTISGALQDLQGVALKVYWWVTRFFTASISVASSDRLNKEILNWLGDQVLTRQGTRILTARSEAVQHDAWHHLRRGAMERNDYYHEKRVPIQYLPTFGAIWFIHERNVFMVRRVLTRTSMGIGAYAADVPDEYAAAPEGHEPLVIMCLGRSVTPIKRFLDTCRDFADKQRESFITVRASKNRYSGELWDTTILRPIRPLETVHFDEITKEELVTDIRKYLDPKTRQFYTVRGIPYRRGYLLHGPPGTGKTSLSLALAGHFGLELYLLHIPSVQEDNDLERLFTALPPRCIVLIEDIDAVGIKRQADSKDLDEGGDIEDIMDRKKRSHCTLSGLLNVLDGVASQEGRIVLMTSNIADNLDSALVRPGRIDRMIFLGNISQNSAEKMFLRMYTPDRSHTSALADTNHEVSEEDLQKLASEFGGKIPENTFTPAQLQGFLLDHRNAPVGAIAQFSVWAKEEKARMEAAEQSAKEAEERRAKKRKEAKMSFLARTVMGRDLGIDLQKTADIARDDMSGEAKGVSPIKELETLEKQDFSREEKEEHLVKVPERLDTQDTGTEEDMASGNEDATEVEKMPENNMGKPETRESKPAEDTKTEGEGREI